jgi:hypothetical protein
MRDIATRLLAVLHNDRSVELMNHEAAEEIMQLRQEVADLRAERDEARRMVCGLDADIMEDQIEYAKHRGWDCFKEKP